jgi:DEAD/DEAH box helicase domain-containing protein
LGEVRVSERVTGFAKRRPFGEGTMGTQPLDLPPQEYDTIGLWLRVPAATQERLAQAGADLTGSLHAVEHAMIALLPLFAQCDAQDVGGVSQPDHPDLQGPGLFIYDSYPGGVGITEAAFARLPELAAATYEAIAACDCDAGCPQCIQSPRCGDMNWPLDKRGALLLSAQLAGRQPAPPPEPSPKPRKAKRSRAQQDG